MIYLIFILVSFEVFSILVGDFDIVQIRFGGFRFRILLYILFFFCKVMIKYKIISYCFKIYVLVYCLLFLIYVIYKLIDLSIYKCVK